jgi:cytochrome c peroxidase
LYLYTPKLFRRVMKLYSISILSIAFIFIASFSNLETKKTIAASPYPETEEELGKMLFMDSILSEDYTLSCASCHKPEFAFADTVAFSKGVRNQIGNRNTPTAMNVLNRPFFFWDGRAASLEEQALIPIENPVEMNLSADSAVARLIKNPFYKESFLRIYGELPSKTRLASALAAFERTLETGSRFDNFSNGDTSALTASEKRGLEIFNEKGKCFDCHFGPDMTGDEFRNIGLYDEINNKDQGRFIVSKDSTDLGKIKVPSLRNVAVTGPYMHDGSFKTLKEVIEYYNDPSILRPKSINRDSLLSKPLGLNPQEISDLEAFLHTLTSNRFIHLIPKK